ncbi:hypothetical protein HG535_0G00910 [Zygotorulaspora mrakii]|uniref:Spindle pole body component n=1 Tax=Zygotorulaspora mrakii TaxID=42260 RepID=A0A7H9B6K7_ZYGMR|nr:uncharacterized protein HG535_0G00910 [Zygotorulaspora mrakii]QLG74207.1 hypothetical protein HG535_0G00910 [Zygotorulaspora mrakii]
MDLEIALFPVVEGLAPHALADKSISLLCRQLALVLQLPTRSIEQIRSVIDSYKIQISYSTDNMLRWQKLLNLLQLLVGIEGSDEMIKYLSAFQSVLVNNSPVRLPTNINLQNASESNMGGFAVQDRLLSPLRPPSLQAESFENLDKFSDVRSMISSNRNYGVLGGHGSVSLEALTEPYYSKTMTEDEVLKFVPYTLLATTSDLFPLEWNDIKVPFNVPNSDSELLHIIFEAGLLNQQLKRIVEQNRNSDISPMKKALIVQIDKELRNYIGFVNELSSSGKLKSLKATYFELYDHLLSLRFYFNFTKSFSTESGDSFLSKSSKLQSHGNLLIVRLSGDVFQTLLSLYFEYMVNWLNMGEIETTCGEFFIENTNAENSPIPFDIRTSKVPDFLPIRVAKEIFIIGKTYIFLANYCKELEWTNNISKKYTNLYRALDTKEITDGFFNIIHNHYREIVNYSHKIILQKFYYSNVVVTLKNILLMGKGDLIDALIKRASEVLMTPSNLLPSHRLTRYLQEAVKHSSLRNMLNRVDENHIINGLDARVLNLGHGSVGWDIFTLDYIVDPPLSIVLNVNRQGGKKEFLRMFNFLWKFKKNDYFYDVEWQKSNQLIRDFKRLSNYRPLVRDILTKLSKINILRSQLNHFSLKLESYCFKCIIDESFQKFEKKIMISDETRRNNRIPTVKLKSGLIMFDGLMKPKQAFLDNISGNFVNCERKQECSLNIDELEKLHNQYLDSMLSHKLIASNTDKKIGYFSGQPYPTSLILLLDQVFEFVTHNAALNDVAHEILIQLNLQSSQQQLNSLLSRFNSVLINIASQYKNFKENAYIFIKDLRSDGDENLGSLSRILR